MYTNLLESNNFTAWMTHSNVTSYNFSITELFNDSGGDVWHSTLENYDPNMTIPANKPGGQYNLHLLADHYINNVHLFGDGYYPLIINNSGLKLACVSCFSEIDNGTSKTVNISVTNYGWTDASSPKISYIKGSKLDSAVSIYSTCGGTIGSSEVTLTSVAANGTQICYVAWTVTAGSDDGSGTSTISVSNAGHFGSITHSYDVEAEEGEEEDGEEEPTVTPTTGTTTTTTSTTTTTTLNYLDITSYPSSVSIEQGKSKTESVKVKNVNETKTQAVTLSVLYLNQSWYRIPIPSALIRTEQTYTFKVNFTIPSDAKVDDYDAKFNASSRYIEVFKPFTLTVTPGAEMKKEIDESLSNYTDQLSELEREINETKMKGYNTSEADSLLEVLKAKIEDALDYRDADDYKAAYDLFDDIESLLNQTRTSIREVSAGDWWSWGRYVIIIAVGAGGAFLGYLFWPTPSYKEKGVAPKPKEEVKEKFTEKFQKLKDKWKELKEKKESGIKDES